MAVFYPALLAFATSFVRLPMTGMTSTAPSGARRHIVMAAPRGRGPPPPEHMINEFIKSPELRVVGEPEQPDMPDVQLGVMSRSDALARAREEGVDLVCISPGASPPVCKIIDYGRYRFQAEKRKKMIKKASTPQEMKEIKLSYTIETHDFLVRVKAAQKFLLAGDKVKAVVQFKGREMQHTDIGVSLLQRLAEQLADQGATDGPPKLSGNRMEMYVTPKPKKQ